MRATICILAVLLAAFVGTAAGQVKTGWRAATKTADLQSDPGSKTYADTVRLLKAWIDDFEEANLVRLFTEGDARVSDLGTACQSNDDKTATAAYLILDLLDAPRLADCADSIERRRGGLFHWTGADLSDADIERVDQWLAERQSPNGFRCGKNDESDIDDAAVFSLILNGSPLAESVLTRMQTFAKACIGGDTLFLIQDAEPLTASARKIGHDLKIDQDIGGAIRASAFFVPSEARDDSEVVVLARTSTRILVKVTYHVGVSWGGIFYIVLRKDGSVWQYALIRRWASF